MVAVYIVANAPSRASTGAADAPTYARCEICQKTSDNTLKVGRRTWSC